MTPDQLPLACMTMLPCLLTVCRASTRRVEWSEGVEQGLRRTVPPVDNGALSLCARVRACVRACVRTAGVLLLGCGAFLTEPSSRSLAGSLVRPWSPKTGPTCCATSSRCDGLLQIPALAVGSRVRGLRLLVRVEAVFHSSHFPNTALSVRVDGRARGVREPCVSGRALRWSCLVADRPLLEAGGAWQAGNRGHRL